MVCSHCGTPLTTSSRFCRGCGLRVGDAPGGADDGATVVVSAQDAARTVVVTPPTAWPDPEDEAPTGSVPVVSDPARFTPGSQEFRAQPTVVISAEEVRRLVSPDPASPPVAAARPADTAELEWPERWPRDDTREAAPALDLEAQAVPPFTGDETVVVRAYADSAGTVAIPLTADLERTVVVPAFDPSGTVAVPVFSDPAGTVVVPVPPAPPEPATMEDTAPLPVFSNLDAVPPSAPAPAPAADLSWAPTPDPAAAWWASSAERTAAMRTPDPPPVPAEVPEPAISTAPAVEPPTAPLVFETPAGQTASATPTSSPAAEHSGPGVAVPSAAEPPPLPVSPEPPPPVAAAPFVPPPAPPPTSPVAEPPPPAPVAAPPSAVAAASVPASVNRAALGGSAMKLVAWVAALAVVAALGVTAARRWAAGSPAEPAGPAPAAAPAAGAPAVPAPAPPASCETERDLKSTPGSGEALLQVTNKTAAPVVVHWLNLAGARERWFEVSPGAMRRQRTPPTYRWVVARADGTCLAVIAGQGTVVVE